MKLKKSENKDKKKQSGNQITKLQILSFTGVSRGG